MDEYKVMSDYITQEIKKLRLGIDRLEESRRKMYLNRDKRYLKKIDDELAEISRDAKDCRKKIREKKD